MNPILFGTVFGAIMIYILICIFTDDDFNNYKKISKNMIIEDHVSLEVAQLLKEKGFNEQTDYIYYYYEEDNDWCFEKLLPGDIFRAEKMLHCPSLAMAMKWLREKKYIEINISLSALNKDWSKEYMYDIFFTNERYLEKSITKTGFKSYEEACEEAIKYCLTKLI